MQNLDAMQAAGGDEANWLKVVDPMAGTYYIPWTHVHPTNGTASFAQKPRDISLCLLFQKGVCPMMHTSPLVEMV